MKNLKSIIINLGFFLFLNQNMIFASMEKKFVPLKEITSRNDFWTNSGVISYFCMRCSGLYFAMDIILAANKPLDRGNQEKILQRAKKREFYVYWATKMWEAACADDDPEQKVSAYVDILSIANQYVQDSEQSKLTCGNLDLKDDLDECTGFLELLDKRYKKKYEKKKK